MAANPQLAHLRAWGFALFNAAISWIAAGLLRAARLIRRESLADFCGPLLRRVGPWLPEHKVGRANLKAAFPEKSPAEIETILRGVWDNLGRFAADFAHLDRLRIFDPANPGPHEIEYSEQTLARFETLRTSGQGALLFAVHLGNWELPALVAHRYGVEATILYRRPNIPAIAGAVVRVRAGSMGTLTPSGIEAPVVLANALAAGQTVGMLVDQYYRPGVDVTFFGQVTRANPLIARLARQIERPIHGTRVIRLPGNRFRVEMSEAIEPARDPDGRIDIAGTMQAITDVIEGWVREHPEQWLWVHRRWRPDDPPKIKGTVKRAQARR